jgi:hypothetical protein
MYYKSRDCLLFAIILEILAYMSILGLMVAYLIYILY